LRWDGLGGGSWVVGGVSGKGRGAAGGSRVWEVVPSAPLVEVVFDGGYSSESSESVVC